MSWSKHVWGKPIADKASLVQDGMSVLMAGPWQALVLLVLACARECKHSSAPWFETDPAWLCLRAFLAATFVAPLHSLRRLLELRGRAAGWRSLPPHVLGAIQPLYQCNLSKARLAANVNTLLGDVCMAMDHDVLMCYNFSLRGRENLFLLFHELEHVAQCERCGGFEVFMVCYVVDMIIAGVKHGELWDPHDLMQFEIQADEKAEQVLELLEQAGKLTSHTTIHMSTSSPGSESEDEDGAGRRRNDVQKPPRAGGRTRSSSRCMKLRPLSRRRTQEL